MYYESCYISKSKYGKPSIGYTCCGSYYCGWAHMHEKNVYYFHGDKGHGPKYYLSELVKLTQFLNFFP